jgi:hypothetical protein
MSGETLFKASARLQLPGRCDLAALKKDLEKSPPICSWMYRLPSFAISKKRLGCAIWLA